MATIISNCQFRGRRLLFREIIEDQRHSNEPTWTQVFLWEPWCVHTHTHTLNTIYPYRYSKHSSGDFSLIKCCHHKARPHLDLNCRWPSPTS